MNQPKGNSDKEKTQVIRLRPELYAILDQEYESLRPKPETLSRLVNYKLENEIKIDTLLRKQFPHLVLLKPHPEIGFIIQDNKRNVIVVVTINHNSILDSYCNTDKSNNCEHVKYTLSSPALGYVLPDSYISGSNGGDQKSNDDATASYPTERIFK